MAAIALVAVLWAAHGTGFDRQRLSVLRPGRHVAEWSQPCWRPAGVPRAERRFTLPCARVTGRVLYRQRRDPDGDGDEHLLVVAGDRLLNLKFRRRVRVAVLPGVGRRIRVTGVLGHGRFGVPEVDVSRVG